MCYPPINLGFIAPCEGSAMPVTRRHALLGLTALPLAGGACAQARARGDGAQGRAPGEGAQALDAAEWGAFRTRFVRSDGRVVDTGNGGISHSEGQGWALLCAERAGDRESFERILSWSRQTLQRRGDALFAWRFRPDGASGGQVDDPNNATDGDLMIAWALLRAGARWSEPEHVESGTAIARDILRLLVRQVGDEIVLLPGAAGFEQRDHVVVNLSYYAFPAIRALARVVPDPLWLRVAADGLGLMRRARFGRWGLPPDWLALPRAGGRVAPAPGWPARFSYDAVRVPLYLAWAGLGREPAAAGAARFWADPTHPRLPAWTDLASDAVSPYPASAGIRAISRLSAARAWEDGAPPDLPSLSDAKDYYSAVLTLLVRLAWRESTTTSI
jgi:endoglucanase